MTDQGNQTPSFDSWNKETQTSSDSPQNKDTQTETTQFRNTDLLETQTQTEERSCDSETQTSIDLAMEITSAQFHLL